MTVLSFLRRVLCVLLSAAIVSLLVSYAQTSSPPAVPKATSGQRLAPMLLFAGSPVDSASPLPSLIAQQAVPAKPVAQPAPSGQELIAVLDPQAIGSAKAQASAMSDRLREALLNTGNYILVNREQIDAALNGQALHQTGQASSECAVKVGQVRGVRKRATGSVTKLHDRRWQLSANVIDVETARPPIHGGTL